MTEQASNTEHASCHCWSKRGILMEQGGVGLCCCCCLVHYRWVDQENRSDLINRPAFVTTESTYINGPAQLKK